MQKERNEIIRIWWSCQSVKYKIQNSYYLMTIYEIWCRGHTITVIPGMWDIRLRNDISVGLLFISKPHTLSVELILIIYISI
jgi:hypothetical protein